jgi:hypothetical protein
MDIPLMRRWLALDERKRQLKAELDGVEDGLKQIQDTVLAQFTESGVNNLSLDGRTVYVACDRWPKVKGDKTALLKTMKENGLGGFVKENFNTQSLRGVMSEWYREHEAELSAEERATFTANDAIPEAFRDVLEYSETYTVKSCKS